jgi:hypothetical protein
MTDDGVTVGDEETQFQGETDLKDDEDYTICLTE